MKDIEITQDCFVKGESVTAGEILKNVDTSTAAQLLSSGRAKRYFETEKEAPKVAKKAAKKTAKKDEA